VFALLDDTAHRGFQSIRSLADRIPAICLHSSPGEGEGSHSTSLTVNKKSILPQRRTRNEISLRSNDKLTARFGRFCFRPHIQPTNKAVNSSLGFSLARPVLFVNSRGEEAADGIFSFIKALEDDGKAAEQEKLDFSSANRKLLDNLVIIEEASENEFLSSSVRFPRIR
jgi:hypothetical protein